MVTLSIIVLAAVVLALAVQVIMFRRLDKRIEQLEKDLLINKQLYDSLEEQVSKQYADYAGVMNRLVAVEGWMAKPSAKTKKK